MTESTLTHQIGFTRTNCAWIALNLFLNILMCYLVLQISPRPNETSMNPYYGPNHIGDLPKDYDKVLEQVEKGATLRRGQPSKLRRGQPMAVVYTKLLFLNSTQILVNTLSHITAHRIQLISYLIIHRRQPKPQIAMPHYTLLHNLLPVS